MNTNLKIPALCAGLLLLTGLHLPAQVLSTEGGLLGRFYVGADYTHQHFTGEAAGRTRGGSAMVNFPYTATLDLGFAYDYAHLAGTGDGATTNAFTASVLTHNQTEYGKGYFAAGLGHAWDNVRQFGVSERDNNAFWMVRIGYEMPFGPKMAVNAGVGYTDTFGRGLYRMGVVQYRLEANRWFSNVVAGVISASYQQVSKAPNALYYTAGLRWSF